MTMGLPASPVPGACREPRLAGRRRLDPGRLRWTVLVFVLWMPACVSNPELPTVWPPEDFYLEVEQQAPVDGHMMVVSRFQVWADGLTLYRAADDVVADPEGTLELPVFRRACAFELKPESTRMLARMLYLRGILDLEALQGDVERSEETEAIRLVYTGFGQSRTVVARGAVRGSMVSVLRAINAFLPEGEEVRLKGLRGGGEPRRLDGVPRPRDDAAGALALHVSLADRRPDDQGLLEDAFALACALERREVAEDLLQRWEARGGLRGREASLFPEDVEAVTVESLRRLLDQD